MKTAKSNKNKRISGRRLTWLILLFVVLLAMGFAAVMLLLRRGSQVVVEEAVYQFGMTEKYEFGSGTKLLAGKNDMEIEDAEGERITGDATPIYYQNSTSMILPKDMSWLDFTTGTEWRIPAFSVLTMDENGVIRCETGKDTVVLVGGFLNDGAGTYTFLDNAVLMLNGESVSVRPFSFCSASSEQVRVYDYGASGIITEARGGRNLTLTSKQGYTVDMTTGIYYGADDTFRLLVAAPSALRNINERG